MNEDDLGFGMYPEVEDLDIEGFSDVQKLRDDGVIAAPQHYGFDTVADFVDFLVHEVDGEETYDMLQEESIGRWSSFLTQYDEAGSVLYNPENGDEWYTDDDDLIAEGI